MILVTSNDECDLDVWLDVDGYYYCRHCSMYHNGAHAFSDDLAGMIAHMLEHRKRGHKVPDSAFAAVSA